MHQRDAVALLAPAVQGHHGPWADLGAGDGTFTRALVTLLGPQDRVYAVDRDASSVRTLRNLSRELPNVVAIEADVGRPIELPEPLSGMLLANVLHFLPDPSRVLAALRPLLRTDGRVVIVEYDRREASRWVPFPLPMHELPAVLERARLAAPEIVATRPSRYQGTLYVALSSWCRAEPG